MESNSVSVMKAFPTENLARDIRSLDLSQDNFLAKRLRCDRSSNFVSGKSDLDEPLAEMDKKSVERYLSEAENSSSTHRTRLILAGSWKRQIGTIRRILDAMLVETGVKKLTHELLVTLMSEVAAIVYPRPITAIPSDTDEPLPLTPSTLLTQN